MPACSGPMTCTMPCRLSSIPKYVRPAGSQYMSPQKSAHVISKSLSAGSGSWGRSRMLAHCPPALQPGFVKSVKPSLSKNHMVACCRESASSMKLFVSCAQVLVGLSAGLYDDSSLKFFRDEVGMLWPTVARVQSVRRTCSEVPGYSPSEH